MQPQAAGDTQTPTDGLDLSDPDAFGCWYQTHWMQAVGFAYRLTGDASLAEDIAADALLRSWQRWQMIGAPERPWAYVVRVIRNLVATHFRRLQQDRSRLGVLAALPQPSHESGIVDRAYVRYLLPLLPANERTAVALHYLDDAPSAEVADHLAVRPATARSHLHRARRRLAALAVA